MGSPHAHTHPLTGTFRHLVLEGCPQVTLRGVTAARLELRRSTVVLEDTTLIGAGDEPTLLAEASFVEMTGGSITGGPVAVRVSSGGYLDLAGVRLEAAGTAIEAVGEASVLLSVCPVTSTHTTTQSLHGLFEVTAADPL